MNKPTGALQRQTDAFRAVVRLTATARAAEPTIPAPRWEVQADGDIAVRAAFDGPAGLVALNAWRRALGGAAEVSSRRTDTGMAWALTVRQDGVTVVLSADAVFTHLVAPTALGVAA